MLAVVSDELAQEETHGIFLNCLGLAMYHKILSCSISWTCAWLKQVEVPNEV